MKYVYIVNESGSWDFEETGGMEVFDTFEKALKRFNELVEFAKQDMKNWCDEKYLAEELTIQEDKEYANFNIYEDGEAVKLHDYISILKKEVK